MVSHFKTNTPKQTLHGTGKKLSKQKIQNIRNPFILRKKKRNLIREKKETNNRLIKDIIIRDIRTLLEEEDYYKLKRVSNFWNNNYVEYQNNGDKDRNLSLDEYLNKMKSYLRDITIDLQNSDT